ncbi:MAG TPA: AMP-binding protein [Acidimicrobiales bacterium]|nr:AMP-binding protein [Acidimicrobiales bacterium]
MVDLILANTGSARPGLYFEDEAYTHGEVVAHAHTRAAALAAGGLAGAHVGVLLENVPEAIFWLEGVALAGGTTVGLNYTRRGLELGRDIRHTHCRLLVTDTAGVELLADADVDDIPKAVVDSSGYTDEWIRPYEEADFTAAEVSGQHPFVLIFTSGTTSAPKAAICTHGRLAAMATGFRRFGLTEDDVAYNSMPWFHSNAMYVSVGPSIGIGMALALRRRFSASNWIRDVKRYGVTYFNYVGKPLEYILATPERPDDADNRVRLGIGNEANEDDVERFSRRFGVEIRENFGSTEGGITIVRVPGQPKGALGVAEGVKVLDPGTGEECPVGRFDEHGRLVNSEEAIGEFVNSTGLGTFEGYYNNDAANRERNRNGWYWSGDLGYRDGAGYLYFAGRGYDWVRVDGENFAAAPVERILLRHPDVRLVAVYAVPDAHVGDRVMAALRLDDGVTFDPEGFARFLGEQADLGPKWVPTYVRVVSELPLTATNKIEKRRLRAERWNTTDPVWMRDGRGLFLRLMQPGDVEAVEKAIVDSGRAALLSR